MSLDALRAALPPHVLVTDTAALDIVRADKSGHRSSAAPLAIVAAEMLVGGVGIGFANVVRPGRVALVAASGTGAQQLMCLLDGAGVGVSACLGVGGRDLSAAVGGRSTRQALSALDADPGTDLVVVVSKPPAAQVADEVGALAARCATSVLLALLGEGAPDLTAVAEQAVAR